MVNNDKRQRHKAGHRSQLEEARAVEARQRRNRTAAIVGCLLVVIVAGTIMVSLTGREDKQAVKTASSTTVPTESPDSKPAGAAPPTVSIPIPAVGAALKGPTPCPKADGSSPRTTSFAEAPPVCIDIDKAKRYEAVVKTSEGDITIDLDSKQSPIAVNNFVVLSRYHFFDGVPFHRIVEGFVNQTGDAAPGAGGLGTGGPGYDLPEEDPTQPYAVGDVALARAEKVSGSQFFFTLDPAPLNSAAPGQKYPILGKVVKGQDIVDKINTFGAATGEGSPSKVVTIDSVTINES